MKQILPEDKKDNIIYSQEWHSNPSIHFLNYINVVSEQGFITLLQLSTSKTRPVLWLALASNPQDKTPKTLRRTKMAALLNPMSRRLAVAVCHRISTPAVERPLLPLVYHQSFQGLSSCQSISHLAGSQCVRTFGCFRNQPFLLAI